jgi:small subunit ribosomal protein S17e
VKKIAREIVKRYPDKFTTSFEDNKKLIGTVSNISSARLRNRIAGYVTRLMAIKKAAEAMEAEEAAEGAETAKEEEEAE